jgi:hypothetical protein
MSVPAQDVRCERGPLRPGQVQEDPQQPLGAVARTLSTQLDEHRIRGLELDFHDSGYEQFGDYRLRHLKPGVDVVTGEGNADTLLLRDWLGSPLNPPNPPSPPDPPDVLEPS